MHPLSQKCILCETLIKNCNSKLWKRSFRARLWSKTATRSCQNEAFVRGFFAVRLLCCEFSLLWNSPQKYRLLYKLPLINPYENWMTIPQSGSIQCNHLLLGFLSHIWPEAILHISPAVPPSIWLNCNTGWWLSHPSEKYEFVSWDDEIPNWKVIKFHGSKPPTRIIC